MSVPVPGPGEQHPSGPHRSQPTGPQQPLPAPAHHPGSGPAHMPVQQPSGPQWTNGSAQDRRGPQNRTIDTSSGRNDGLNKCPRCGSSDISYSLQAQALMCAYCRHQWNEPNALSEFGLDTEIDQLHGHTMASGTADIAENSASVVTIKCQGCGAEVVIAANEKLQARCHWCRQTLSINTQIPNGMVPDALLPFRLTREEAVQRIRDFAGNRTAFAHATFKREFQPENVIGVYIPYMVVDGNVHAEISGRGEIETRRYTETRKVGDRTTTTTYYDASVWEVGRSFDMLLDDITVESASRFDARQGAQATNNILDAVQPYDTENAVIFNPAYLQGYNSERRDLNVSDLDYRIEEKFLTAAREKAIPTIRQYDRGVQWTHEGVKVRGTRWVSIAVPVWLYSYAQSARSGSGLVHYIAVNGRTGNTMGSVPVSHPKIASCACALGLLAGGLAGAVSVPVFMAGM